ncbi:GlyGly-CTERM sorting domain-containing protein [Pseudomonas tructae]|nr:GlyGly-CTERM sorting domain-containing protein [Pseudomonas tructae]
MFLKAAGWLTLAFVAFMAWRRRKKAAPDWSPGGDY